MAEHQRASSWRPPPPLPRPNGGSQPRPCTCVHGLKRRQTDRAQQRACKRRDRNCNCGNHSYLHARTTTKRLHDQHNRDMRGGTERSQNLHLKTVSVVVSGASTPRRRTPSPSSTAGAISCERRGRLSSVEKVPGLLELAWTKDRVISAPARGPGTLGLWSIGCTWSMNRSRTFVHLEGGSPWQAVPGHCQASWLSSCGFHLPEDLHGLVGI